MGAVCQVMVKDFLYGVLLGNENYDIADLQNGIAFTEWELEEGRSHDELHGYELSTFIAWAKRRIIDKALMELKVLLDRGLHTAAIPQVRDILRRVINLEEE